MKPTYIGRRRIATMRRNIDDLCTSLIELPEWMAVKRVTLVREGHEPIEIGPNGRLPDVEAPFEIRIAVDPFG